MGRNKSRSHRRSRSSSHSPSDRHRDKRDSRHKHSSHRSKSSKSRSKRREDSLSRQSSSSQPNTTTPTAGGTSFVYVSDPNRSAPSLSYAPTQIPSNSATQVSWSLPRGPPQDHDISVGYGPSDPGSLSASFQQPSVTVSTQRDPTDGPGPQAPGTTVGYGPSDPGSLSASYQQPSVTVSTQLDPTDGSGPQAPGASVGYGPSDPGSLSASFQQPSVTVSPQRGPTNGSRTQAPGSSSTGPVSSAAAVGDGTSGPGGLTVHGQHPPVTASPQLDSTGGPGPQAMGPDSGIPGLPSSVLQAIIAAVGKATSGTGCLTTPDKQPSTLAPSNPWGPQTLLASNPNPQVGQHAGPNHPRVPAEADSRVSHTRPHQWGTPGDPHHSYQPPSRPSQQGPADWLNGVPPGHHHWSPSDGQNHPRHQNPPHYQSTSGGDQADSWDSIPSGQGDDSHSSSQGSSSESDDDPQEEAEDRILSFSDALKTLQSVDASFLIKREEKMKSTTASERILKASPSTTSSQLPLIKEAEIVTDAIKSALEAARGSNIDWPQGSLPEFPDALQEGRVLKPSPVLSIRGTPKHPVQHRSLPPSSLTTSRDDLAIVPPGLPLRHTTPIPLSTISHMEEMMRRALEAASIMDAFMGGMFAALRTPGLKHFEVAPKVDSRTVSTLGETASEALKSLTNSVARAHLSLAMVKRDSLLARSNSVRSTHTRTALRNAPISSGSYFGGLIGPLIKSQAEANRDMAFLLPPRPTPRHAPAPQKRPSNQPPSAPPKRFRPQPADKSRRPQARPSNKPQRPPKRPAGQGRQAFRPHPQ